LVTLLTCEHCGLLSDKDYVKSRVTSKGIPNHYRGYNNEPKVSYPDEKRSWVCGGCGRSNHPYGSWGFAGKDIEEKEMQWD